jgi:hypothetical protein
MTCSPMTCVCVHVILRDAKIVATGRGPAPKHKRRIQATADRDPFEDPLFSLSLLFMRPEEGKEGQPTGQVADSPVGRPKSNVGSRNTSPTGQSVDLPLFVPHKQEGPRIKTLFQTVSIRALRKRGAGFGREEGACRYFGAP